MRTKYLACETLRDEIEYIFHSESRNENGQKAASEKSVNFGKPEIIWLESGLHNFPKKLHNRLQESIDQVTDCDRLILLFGRCGNSSNQLKSGSFELIIPKADDCISLLFGSDQARNAYAGANAAYYLTEGWMRGERNVWVEYQYTVEKYGEKDAKVIADMMYGHYKQLALLDTGVGNIEELVEQTAVIEETLGLKRTVIPATLSYLKELIYGPWDRERYYILKPFEEVTLSSPLG
ncbi:MAG: DUF1638 domain-containing protein [Lachnospiraceae bacterium]|nr:DUF1638 domain-containing protein [Lachnospiraceae bacterium]